VLLRELPVEGQSRVSGLRCGHCHSQAAFIVTRDVPGSPEVPACRSHLSLAAEKTAEVTEAGSVTAYLLNAKSPALGGENGVAEILERVRRIRAHSAGRPDAAHQMEDALYLAVLVMIAHGARGPSGLASAALTSRNYEFRRECG
jgi:hypothetical protein